MVGVYKYEERLTLRTSVRSCRGVGSVELFKARAGLRGAVRDEETCRLSSKYVIIAAKVVDVFRRYSDRMPVNTGRSMVDVH
jgi:hypothetical protein